MEEKETPKKIIESDRCFICSAFIQKKEKINIFGKSSWDFPLIISSCLDVNVKTYSASEELSVCKNQCYKRLIKFKKASDHLEDIKQELKSIYKDHNLPRTKRLISEDADVEDSTSSNRVKAAKCLEFPTTCTSFCSPSTSSRLFFGSLPNNELVQRAFPAFSPRYQAISTGAFPLPNPTLTSTPIHKSGVSKGNSINETTETILTVKYPSKTMNKTLCGSYQVIAKTLAHGVPSKIASAVMKNSTLKNHILEKTLRILSQEVSGLCSTKNPSLLRMSSKEDLAKFDLQNICNEWKERAPLFYAFLMTSAVNKRTKDYTWFSSVALAGSVLLKQKNEKMDATASVIGVLLKSKSIETTISRFNKMKLTNANFSILRKLDELGVDHDADLVLAKKQISEHNKHFKSVQEKCNAVIEKHASHTCSAAECHSEFQAAIKEKNDIRKMAHPGFVISFDNLDINLQRKNMTMELQNQDFHWVNHQMVTNRVSGSMLDSKAPKKDLMDVCNVKFLPSMDDQRCQRLNYIVLCSRILVDYFEALAPLRDACIQHIPHKYTYELSQKTNKVPLGLIFKNENVNEDMKAILDQFHGYLPHTCDGGIDGQLFSGDQLTVERAVNVISSTANGYTPQDRLEGINLQIGDWHAAVKLLSLIYSKFFSGKSATDSCTLFSDRNLINRRNVTSDVKSAYRPDRDFLWTVFQSRVIVAAKTVLGFDNKTAVPTKFKLPSNMDVLKKSEKLECLHELAGKVVDAFVFDQTTSVDSIVNTVLTEQEKENLLNQQELTPDGRFPCRFPGCTSSFKYNGKSRRNHELKHEPPVVLDEYSMEIPVPTQDSSSKEAISETTEEIKVTTNDDLLKEKKETSDDVFNYNCSLLTDCFLFFNFLDAIKEGDGNRIMRQYKYFMLYCKADGEHSVKYSLECLYQFFLVYSVLSPRDSERFVWNRSVNNQGKKGSNIPLDESTEHSNNFIKQSIKNLGPNLTQAAVSRICKAESLSSSILDNLDETLKRHAKSGKHSNPSRGKDLDELIKRAEEMKVYEENLGRSYGHFSNFQRDRLEDLDASNLYNWINKHKKNMLMGVRAR